MLDDVLAGIQQDEDFDFDSLVEKDEQEKETPADSPTEEQPEEESPSQEGEEAKSDDSEEAEDTTAEDKIPFHKHPRWQEMLNENRSLKEKLSEVSEGVEKGFESIKEEIKSTSPQKPPVEFAELTGLNVDDPNTALAWQKFQKLMPSHSKEELKKELFAEWQAEQQKQQQQEQQIMEWSRAEMKKLEDSGKTFDKNKLLKVIEKYSPVDSRGYTDFNKAYEIYQLEEKVKQEKKDKVVEGKKKLSSRANSGGTEGTPKKDFVSPEDIAGKDWRDLI